ncbi:hypothetical protein TNCV_3617991 [Trichonephila clavipes]|nr:hypothetical protein TNCV_3617991 [Trichonephila clavipes]
MSSSKLHSKTKKKRRTKKELPDCNEISYGKTFVLNMQMITIWCPTNEYLELQCIGTAHSGDKARPHTARLIACQTLPWSAISPYLSSIEHVWDMMGRRLHLPGNAEDLAK